MNQTTDFIPTLEKEHLIFHTFITQADFYGAGGDIKIKPFQYNRDAIEQLFTHNTPLELTEESRADMKIISIACLTIFIACAISGGIEKGFQGAAGWSCAAAWVIIHFLESR